jgi:hypothetical protein
VTRALFGYVLAGDVELRRARAGAGPLGPLHLQASQHKLPEEEGEVLQQVSAAGVRLTVKQQGEGILLTYTPSGNYLLDAKARRIAFDGTPGDVQWEHRLVSLAIPLLLAEQGELSLHAAAVVGPSGGAVLFCGPTGRGKSTAAAILAARDYELLSEDGIVVTDVASEPRVWPGPRGVLTDRCPEGLEDWIVQPGLGNPGRENPAPDLTLAPPEAAPRNRVLRLPPGPSVVNQAHPVRAVVVMARRTAAGIAAEPATLYEPTHGLAALLPATIFSDPSRSREVLPRLARLVERVPIYRVSLPEGLGPAGDELESLLMAVG